MKLSKVVDEVEFAKYIEFFIHDYSQDITENFHLTVEQALEESEAMINDLFIEGLSSEGQFLYKILDSETGEKVGMLWYSITPEINLAYLNHIFIDEHKRGKGYGSKTLEVLQGLLKEQGVESIGLSVFGKNEAAYRLYRNFGFSNTRISMEKRL